MKIKISNLYIEIIEPLTDDDTIYIPGLHPTKRWKHFWGLDCANVDLQDGVCILSRAEHFTTLFKFVGKPLIKPLEEWLIEAKPCKIRKRKGVMV